MAIRVLLADDHEVVRRGLKSLFEGTDIQVVAEASSGHEALKLVKEKKWTSSCWTSGCPTSTV